MNNPFRRSCTVLQEKATPDLNREPDGLLYQIDASHLRVHALLSVLHELLTIISLISPESSPASTSRSRKNDVKRVWQLSRRLKRDDHRIGQHQGRVAGFVGSGNGNDFCYRVRVSERAITIVNECSRAANLCVCHRAFGVGERCRWSYQGVELRCGQGCEGSNRVSFRCCHCVSF